jgi:glycosyltransferase involved in cell wall biosynthesis
VAELTYIFFGDPAGPDVSDSDLPFCREVITVPKPPAYGLAKTLKGLVGSTPLPVLNYSSDAMSAAVRSAMDRHDFDIVHLDSMHMIRYAEEAVSRRPSMKTVYNWHNIESEAMRRYAATTALFARRWYAALTAGKMARLERSMLRTAFGHIVCSSRESEHLLELSPGARIAVVENGVDTAYFADIRNRAAKSAERKIVFVGAMDYFPNQDAAVFFVNSIWPVLRRRLPDVELAIVGANPGAEVLALGDIPGIHVTGLVPDVRPWYAGAMAAVVPLRTGGGTRLKILEAMAAGVPVISTPLGAEGLAVTHQENILLADQDDAEGWAELLVKLVESPERREQLAGAGLRLVETRYDWEIIGSRLRQTYEAWHRETER